MTSVCIILNSQMQNPLYNNRAYAFVRADKINRVKYVKMILCSMKAATVTNDVTVNRSCC